MLIYCFNCAVVILTVLTIISELAFACIFSHTIVKNPPRDHWDYENYPRKYSPGFNCDCGDDSGNIGKPWNFQVHIVKPTWSRICTGTLIASNLVVTSHVCLIRDGSRMSPYEAWNPVPENAIVDGGPEARVKPEDLKLTVYPKDDTSPILKVSRIIYDLRFTQNSASGSFPEDDIAILVLSEHISLQTKYRPICLPEFSPNLDISKQIGHYYGVGAQVKEDPTPEFRTASDLQILEGPECDDEAGFGTFSGRNSLCVRFRLPAPTIAGGPLILGVGDASTSTAFLGGIASIARKPREGTRLSYVYFTNIVPMIKYLEFQAELHGSFWCRTPVKFKLQEKAPLVNVLEPWEKQSFEREESLDCTCGIKSNELSRIAGGEEAEPYEFGWMARIKFQFFNGIGRTCGGSIINNLFVLTAAHCVVNIGLLLQFGKDGLDKALPEKTQVFIRTHRTNGDPHEIQLGAKKIFVHPEYIDGEWEYRERNAKKSGYSFYLGSDIALILLDKPITFDKVTSTGMDIRPVCLPRIGRFVEFLGKMATVSGWGVTNPEDPLSQQMSSEVLLKLEKPILSLIQCSSHSEVVMTDDVICAGYLNRSMDSASGDSGGFLILKDEKTGRWTQVGIVSYGVDYYENGKYKLTTAHYTNVQNFLRFIDYYSKSERAEWCQSPLN